MSMPLNDSSTISSEIAATISPQERMLVLQGQCVPQAPTTLEETNIDPQVLLNLALKLAYTTPRFNTRWAAARLCLPLQLIGELLEQLRQDQLIEVLGQEGPFSFFFSITGSGRERRNG